MIGDGGGQMAAPCRSDVSITGDDRTYPRFFEPFPVASARQRQRIRALGEQLDALRNVRQQAHPNLTMTAMYSVLDELHHDLDRAVSEAYA